MAIEPVQRDDQYVLNHCTKYLARTSTERRHGFDQYALDDPRAQIAEAWRFPVIDSHWDGSSAATSYQFNDVTFVYDSRARAPASVEVVGTFGPLYATAPL